MRTGPYHPYRREFLRFGAYLVSLVASIPVVGQTNKDIASPIGGAVVVETVEHHSAGEQAGLRPGDVLVGWKRGDVSGPIRSPFDLSEEVEIEQQPRGTVEIHGMRGSIQRTWTIGPSTLGVVVRPAMSAGMLLTYKRGRRMEGAGNFKASAQLWREEAQIPRNPALSAWLFWRAAQTLIKAGQFQDGDVGYEDAVRYGRHAGVLVATKILRTWGDAFFDRKDWSHAQARYQESLEEAQKASSETLLAAVALTRLGTFNLDRGDLEKAADYYGRALAILEKLAPASDDAANAFHNVGTVAWQHSDLVKAKSHYLRALEIRQAIEPNSLEVASDLNELGLVTWRGGGLAEAEQYFQRAWTLRQTVDRPGPDSASYVNNLGLVAFNRGNLRRAEEYFYQALQLLERFGPGSKDLAGVLNNLGIIALERDDGVTAAGYCQRALSIEEKLSTGSLELAAILANLGLAAEYKGNLAQAEAYMQRALEIKDRLAPGTLEVAKALANLADVYQLRKDWVKAEELYSRSLAIAQKIAPDTLEFLNATLRLGDTRKAQHDLAGAEQYYRQAFTVAQKIAHETTSEAEALAGLAAVTRDLGRLEESTRLFEQAIDAIEAQTKSLGGIEEARAAFRGEYATFYSDYIDVLMAQQKPDTAFQIFERSRAQTLLETLSSNADIHRGADPSLLKREGELQESLRLQMLNRLEAFAEKHDAQAAAIDQKIERSLAELRQVQDQIQVSSPVYAALKQPRPMSLAQTQQLLDKETVLLEYSLGDSHSYVFMVRANALDIFPLPKRAEIEEQAQRVYALLAARAQDAVNESATRKLRLPQIEEEYRAASMRLSKMILEPVAAHISSKRLVIVADGALAYIPFAALPEPAAGVAPGGAFHPVILDHEVVKLPSASALAALRQQAAGRPAPPKAVAVLADPVFASDDPRVRNARRGAPPAAETASALPRFPAPVTRSAEDVGMSSLPRLLFSGREANAILAAAPGGLSKRALGFAANRELATSKELGQYRIVHFATHALLDNQRPELSGLVLSLFDPQGKRIDGMLQLEDIYNLRLPVDLVVLSACKTALGKEVRGEGLLGLTRGFMYAGASRVLATLWSVDDMATAELMARFYRGLLHDGMAAPAALRQAQIEIAEQEQWKSPYYWAAFELQGEWE